MNHTSDHRMVFPDVFHGASPPPLAPFLDMTDSSCPPARCSTTSPFMPPTAPPTPEAKSRPPQNFSQSGIPAHHRPSFVPKLLPMGKRGDAGGRHGETNPHRNPLTFRHLTQKIPKWGKFDFIPQSPAQASSGFPALGGFAPLRAPCIPSVHRSFHTNTRRHADFG